MIRTDSSESRHEPVLLQLLKADFPTKLLAPPAFADAENDEAYGQHSDHQHQCRQRDPEDVDYPGHLSRLFVLESLRKPEIEFFAQLLYRRVISRPLMAFLTFPSRHRRFRRRRFDSPLGRALGFPFADRRGF